ncbi:MAG: LPXTG cell wall anchor domain-containing protein [Ardenticatenales bacterium]
MRRPTSAWPVAAHAARDRCSASRAIAKVDVRQAGIGPPEGVGFGSVVVVVEVRLAGTTTVALAVPGVRLDAGNVYTVFAMGLASGQPSLMAVPSLDAAHAMSAPAMLPKTGAADNVPLLLAVVGALMVAAGIARQRAVAVRA